LKINHNFTDDIPQIIENGEIYISTEYATASHLCCCGCGERVVTPISPTDWKLIFNGETISLHPSIGNWSFDCKSHYWIKNNQIIWASQMTAKEISAVRQTDAKRKREYYSKNDKKPNWFSSLLKHVLGR